jgi:hypothetical protein
LVKGEKKILIQILHFLLTKMSDLKKRYYLSRYLSNVNISDEFTGDEEILDTLNKYRELQSDFQAVYSMAEEKRASTPVFFFLILIILIQDFILINMKSYIYIYL